MKFYELNIKIDTDFYIENIAENEYEAEKKAREYLKSLGLEEGIVVLSVEELDD